MSIKKAFEEYYRSFKPPEAMDLKVNLRLERERRRKLLKFALFEAFLVILLVGLYIYQPIRSADYKTFSAGVPVMVVEEIGIKKLSEELKAHQLTIDGPYEGDVFILRGEESKVREFLKGSKNLKTLD